MRAATAVKPSDRACAILQRIKSGDEASACALLQQLPPSERRWLSEEDADGNGGALFWASCKGYADVAALLIACGVPVDVRTCWGATPLHGAADSNRPDVVELLLKHGAAVNARTSNGDTPAHLGAYRGHEEVLRRLARHGANLSLTNGSGCSVAHEAVSGRRQRRHVSVLRAGEESGRQRKQEAPRDADRPRDTELRGSTSGSGTQPHSTQPARRSSRRRSVHVCDCELEAAVKYAAAAAGREAPSTGIALSLMATNGLAVASPAAAAAAAAFGRCERFSCGLTSR